jgi:hypothetical protein
MFCFSVYSGLPQFPQKIASALFSAPQLWQRLVCIMLDRGGWE